MQTLLHWPVFVKGVLGPLAWLVLLGLVFVPLERVFSLHKQKIFRRGTFVDLGWYFFNALALALVLSAPLAIAASVGHRLLPPAYYGFLTATPLWARVTLAFLVAEVGFYWGHRLSHEIPLLWRFHALHHSAEQMDFLVNTRAHVVDLLFTRFCGLVPLSALGLAVPFDRSGTEVLSLIVLVGTVWEFFIHANVRWRFGPLEWLISSPAFHHWHHNLANPINKNYASMFAWLDRVFGTFHAPKGLWPTGYGIPESVPNSLPEQLIQPFLPQKRRPTAAQTRA